MEILHGLESLGPGHRGAVVTLGNFDGVHLGHQKIIRAATEEARSLGTRAMAVTFEPHPVKVLAPDRGLKLLTPPGEKALLMGRYGIDTVLFINFSREFSSQPADDFIRDVLVGALGARAVVVGHGYTFGKGKRGTTELLRRRGRKYGFKVRVVRSARIYGKPVSSSRVRLLLSRGKVAKAAALLGRPYGVAGTVVRGAGRGAGLLGTPTANMAPSSETLPAEGVYAVRVEALGRNFDGVANIGTNPTFHGSGQTLEVHLFGFKGDLLGRELRLDFIERLREERTFPSPEALREQIIRDMEEAKAALSVNAGA